MPRPNDAVRPVARQRAKGAGWGLNEGGAGMVRYVLAAAALKTFSMNRFTRRLYRALGNRFGQRRRRRAGIDCYVERAKFLDELCVRHRAIPDGGPVLEIGTGWVHWYSLYLRVSIA